MDRHVQDEELILQAYGEGSAVDSVWIDAHVAVCPTCRAVRDDLLRTLTLVNAAAVPEPDVAFEAAMWRRVQAALRAERRRSWVRPAVMLTAWAAVVTLVVAATVARRSSAAPAPPAAAVGRSHEGVLLTALDDHLDQTEMLLVELMNGHDPEAADLQFARATADDLVASGRLYRNTAEQNGDARIADVIDDLEPVLLEVARSPEIVSESDVDGWRSQIASENLLFKVRAVSDDVRHRQLTLVSPRQQ